MGTFRFDFEDYAISEPNKWTLIPTLYLNSYFGHPIRRHLTFYCRPNANVVFNKSSHHEDAQYWVKMWIVICFCVSIISMLFMSAYRLGIHWGVHSSSWNSHKSHERFLWLSLSAFVVWWFIIFSMFGLDVWNIAFLELLHVFMLIIFLQ